MGKKKFIEKGEGVKFHLVHRSQRDPLYLDETLGEHVLVPVDPDNEKSSKLIESLQGLKLGAVSKKEREEARLKRVEEQHKYGIYYDDDYDYLQHLRDANNEEAVQLEKEADSIRLGSVIIKDEERLDVGDKADEEEEEEEESAKSRRLVLPSSVFASKFEEEVGYFNQAAPDSDPKIGWDPDIVKFLDDDFESGDFENEDIDDDFFVRANADDHSEREETLNDEAREEREADDDQDDDVSSDLGAYDPDNDFEESESVRDFEKQSRFSQYSMSSSVMRRNDSLKYIDEHFEKFFEQYDDDQIGALDTEDIEGFRCGNGDLVLESAIEEFNKYMQKKYYQPEAKSKLATLAEEESASENEPDENEASSDPDENNNISNNNLMYETVKYTRKKDREDRLDCESVISTYSNLYNRPAIICEKREPKIKLSSKTGMPIGVLPDKKAMSKNQMDKLDHRISRILPEIPERKENESIDEKKARKQAVKEHRRERRVEKKINKTMFKEESKLQTNQMIQAKQSTRGVKLPL